jgi:hypothetical protein
MILKHYKKMSKQELFTFITKHLLEQGAKSAEISDRLGHTCMYRNGNLACAVGCLIPNRSYRKSMEGNDVYTLAENFRTFKVYYEEHLNLLAELQHVHDDYAECYWKEKLVELAERWRVEFEA